MQCEFEGKTQEVTARMKTRDGEFVHLREAGNEKAIGQWVPFTAVHTQFEGRRFNLWAQVKQLDELDVWGEQWKAKRAREHAEADTQQEMF